MRIAQPPHPLAPAVRRVPRTLWLGLAIILLCEALLFTDVYLSGRGAIRTHEAVAALKADRPPQHLPGHLARFVAINMTPLVWVGYLVFLEGVLSWQQGRSPVRRRPNHFALLCLASVCIWCVFDWINFYSIRAWRYIGFPEMFADRIVGYVVAFGTIVPGMLMTGQVLLNMGLFDRASGQRWTMPRWVVGLSVALGLAMLLWPLVHPDPITNLTLWLSFIFLLDPLNCRIGRPSMFGDWQNGWYGRTLAALAGGLVCGLLWEFWNYWALARWVYHLPFLGSAESIRYFEMPVLGLAGFLPFGIECWILWQAMRAMLDGLAEPLPDDRSLL